MYNMEDRCEIVPSQKDLIGNIQKEKFVLVVLNPTLTVKSWSIAEKGAVVVVIVW